MSLLNSIKSICTIKSNNKNNNNGNVFSSNNNYLTNSGINSLTRLPPGYFENSSFSTKGFVQQYSNDGVPTIC